MIQVAPREGPPSGELVEMLWEAGQRESRSNPDIFLEPRRLCVDGVSWLMYLTTRGVRWGMDIGKEWGCRIVEGR